jgi:hypothetical protein
LSLFFFAQKKEKTYLDNDDNEKIFLKKTKSQLPPRRRALYLARLSDLLSQEEGCQGPGRGRGDAGAVPGRGGLVEEREEGEVFKVWGLIFGYFEWGERERKRKN